MLNERKTRPYFCWFDVIESLQKSTNPLTQTYCTTAPSSPPWPLARSHVDVVNSLSGISCRAKTLKSAFGWVCRLSHSNATLSHPLHSLTQYPFESHRQAAVDDDDRCQIERYSSNCTGDVCYENSGFDPVKIYKPTERNRLLLYHPRWLWEPAGICCPRFDSQVRNGWMNRSEGWVHPFSYHSA